MFKGSFVALITPMRADGSFDESSHALGDSVAVVRGDGVVFASGFGPADVEWAAPANDRTVVELIGGPAVHGGGGDATRGTRHDQA